MSCMCGDTMCPSCGPAQGYCPEWETVCEWLECEVLGGLPEAINPTWMAEYLADKLGKDQDVADAMTVAAQKYLREYQAKRAANDQLVRART